MNNWQRKRAAQRRLNAQRAAAARWGREFWIDSRGKGHVGTEKARRTYEKRRDAASYAWERRRLDAIDLSPAYEPPAPPEPEPPPDVDSVELTIWDVEDPADFGEFVARVYDALAAAGWDPDALVEINLQLASENEDKPFSALIDPGRGWVHALHDALFLFGVEGFTKRYKDPRGKMDDEPDDDEEPLDMPDLFVTVTISGNLDRLLA